MFTSVYSWGKQSLWNDFNNNFQGVYLLQWGAKKLLYRKSLKIAREFLAQNRHNFWYISLKYTYNKPNSVCRYIWNTNKNSYLYFHIFIWSGYYYNISYITMNEPSVLMVLIIKCLQWERNSPTQNQNFKSLHWHFPTLQQCSTCVCSRWSRICLQEICVCVCLWGGVSVG